MKSESKKIVIVIVKSCKSCEKMKTVAQTYKSWCSSQRFKSFPKLSKVAKWVEIITTTDFADSKTAVKYWPTCVHKIK